MTASVKNIEYTDVLHESAETSGSVRLKRGKNGLAAIMEFGEPNPYTVHLSAAKWKSSSPRPAPTAPWKNTMRANSPKNMDQFLLLGFGTTGAELKKEYTIALGDAATIDGVQTTRIDLYPKSAELKKLVTKVELWIPASSGNPVREKVLQPSKDYRLVTYSNMKVDTEIPDSAFELNTPKGVRRMPAVK
jgi:hypothetical protein